ncbi:hypothetical protein CR513_43012, partial [Mucuna pruriens]
MNDTKEMLLQAVERIFQYLKANYARSVVDIRSTSEYCRFLGRNLVTRRSKKQNVVTRCIQYNMIKHMEIDKHSIKEKLDNELIIIAHTCFYEAPNNICLHQMAP